MLEKVRSGFFSMRGWNGQGVDGVTGSWEEKDLRRNGIWEDKELGMGYRAGKTGRVKACA